MSRFSSPGKAIWLVFAAGSLTLLGYLVQVGNQQPSNASTARSLPGVAEYALPRVAVGVLPQTPPNRANAENFWNTYDPDLGYAPVEYLFEEAAFQKSLEKARLKSATQSAFAQAFVWSERGPTNIGGRTRALLWDPNDPAGNKVWAGGVTGGLWYNNNITDANSSWQIVSDFWENLSVSAIAYDPVNTQIMYAGTGEGFFTGAARGAGIWKTTDGGQNWSRLSATTNMLFVGDMVVRNEMVGGVPTGVLYVGVHTSSAANNIFLSDFPSGIWRSTNGGTSFTQVLPANLQHAIADLEIGPDGRIYAGTLTDYNEANGLTNVVEGAILYSDNGTTWSANTQYALEGSGITRIDVAVAPSDANTVYALVCHDDEISAIGKSINKGVSFTNLSEPDDVDLGIPSSDFSRGQAWYDLIVAVNPSDANDVVVGGINLHRSTNGGTSWTHLSKWSNNPNLNQLAVSFVHADQHAIAFHPTRANEAIFGTDGGVFWTNQYNSATTSATVFPRNKNYNVTQFYAGAVSGAGTEFYLAGAQDNGTLVMTGTGLQAGNETFGGDGAFCFADPNSNRQIVSYVFNNYYITTANGQNTYDALVEFDSGDFINPADAHFPGNRLYSVDYQSAGNTLIASGIRRTSIPVAGGPASGVTQLLSVSNLVTNGDRPSAIRVSPSSGVSFDVVWIGTRQGRLYRLNSVQSGTTITSGNIQDLTGSNFPTGRRISSINFGPTENHILVTFTQYNTISVFESRDGGTTWQNREGNLPNIPVRWAVYNPLDPTLSQVILATEAGIYVTDNINTASPSWSTTPGFPTVRTDMLRIRTATNTLFAYTHGRGVFSAPLPTVTSNEGPNLAIEAVDVFPNPATTQARVRGTLKRPSAVSFQISDLSGRTRIQRSLGQVATFDETVILTSLSAGSYMLTVRAGEEVKTTRLVVR